MKMVRVFTLASCGLALAAVLGLSQAAQAQTGLLFPNGDSMWLHNSRLQPGANVMIPGTSHFWHDPATGAAGRRYLGLDGRWHGETQFTNSNGTQQTHIYSGHGGGSSGYRPSGSMGGHQSYGRSPYGVGANSPSYRRPTQSYTPRYTPGYGSRYRNQ